MNTFERPTIPLSRDAFRGIDALVELGVPRVKKLSELQCSQPLDLAFSQLFASLASQLACDYHVIQTACVAALIPLNGLRRRLEMPASDFLKALQQTIADRASEEWKSRYIEAWNSLVGELAPFFQPDNFFSQASKAFDLLTERPAILQNARILTELRPIYDEAQTKTLAVLQTNTLVLDYWKGRDIHTLHISLDNDDLKSLTKEVKWAQDKISISQKEALAHRMNLVVYGEVDEEPLEG